MGDILSIRVPPGERAEWEKTAAEVRESVAEYVRNSVRQRTQLLGKSPWEKRIGSADIEVSPPTNANVRAAISKKRP